MPPKRLGHLYRAEITEYHTVQTVVGLLLFRLFCAKNKMPNNQ